jgi:hypothetical protein
MQDQKLVLKKEKGKGEMAFLEQLFGTTLGVQ